MKRFIGFCFGLAALAAALVWPISDASAQVIKDGFAVCESGKCVISEDDWNSLKDFHRAVVDAVERVEGAHRDENHKLWKKLLSCESRMQEKKVGFDIRAKGFKAKCWCNWDLLPYVIPDVPPPPPDKPD